MVQMVFILRSSESLYEMLKFSKLVTFNVLTGVMWR
jgi:hypothetical protein